MLQKIKLHLQDFNLNKSYLNRFPGLREEGLQVFKGFLNEKELNDHLIDFDRLMSNDDIPKLVDSSDKRIYGVERFDDDFISKKQKMFASKFNKNIKVISDNIYFTMTGEISYHPGNLGSGGGWHRDSPFTNQFKTIIYLTDVDSTNGPFQYIKGSHKRSFYKPIGEVLKTDDYRKNRFSNEEIEAVTNKIDFFDKMTVTGKAGDLILVNTRGLHRGAPLLEGMRKAVTTYSFRNRIPNKFFKV